MRIYIILPFFPLLLEELFNDLSTTFLTFALDKHPAGRFNALAVNPTTFFGT